MTLEHRTALLLVDLQRDYLDRPGLTPAEDDLVGAAATLLQGFRGAGSPVAHVRTIVRADGSDAMPHWRVGERLVCVDGSPGAAPPPVLAEADGELLVRKQHYRGFADPRLDPWLRDLGVTRVVICGVYTHACVRETALDAYERGYEVVIAADAVGSDSPSHADLTHDWLSARGATFVRVDEIVGTLEGPTGDAPTRRVRPVAVAATEAQRAWMATPTGERAAALESWADVLGSRRDRLVEAVVSEVAKPIAGAADEVQRAIDHVRSAAALLRHGAADAEKVADGVMVRHRPIGVVGIVMPWNNPLALPCGKIAPALAFGNGVVFKPAPEGRLTAELLMESLAAAGLPPGLVGLVTGAAEVGAAVVREPAVTAVAVTGSIATGRSIAAECARLGKPIQAELGGNNAAIILADADLGASVPALARNAFAFAGQRCTAIRRFVVVRGILDEFQSRLLDATRRLVVGDPADPATDVGPLISRAARDRVAGVVREAVAAGAVLLAGGDHAYDTGDGREARAYFALTVLRVDDPDAAVVQRETFGPVAVIQPADSVDEAIALANGVEQGLVQVVCTRDAAAAAAVLDRADAGLTQWGPGIIPVHPEAPFGGWKASGFGPPEHGRWDAAFFTRAQAAYGPDA